MNKFYLSRECGIMPILVLVWVACSTSGNKEIVSTDSTTVADTVVSVQSEEKVATATTEIVEKKERYPDEDLSLLDERYDSLFYLVESIPDIERVDISTTQYEASSEVTWYYLGPETPAYFKMDWSSEGREGYTELIVVDGIVVGASIKENNTYEKWSISTGGYRLTYHEENSSQAPDTTHLYGLYGDAQNVNLKDFQNTFLALIKECEFVGAEGINFVYEMKRVVNYGSEFTETTTISINKNLSTNWFGGE